jgi:AcrR family transcriptional regulator
MSKRIAADDGRSKGARTRQRILERAATLFNTRGVAGASMADITAASGLEKGGVYNHFASKDALALAAFDYAAALVLERLGAAASAHADPLARLGAILEVYRNIGERPPLHGGCPLLNAAIDADDTNAALRDRVRAAMDGWRVILTSALEDAILAKAVVQVDVEAFASTVIAALEGGVMLSSLYRDATHMRAVVDHLQRWIASLALPPAASVS